jgi:hypothetical protein
MRVVGSQVFGHELKHEGIFHVLISTVGWHVDGDRRFFSLGSLGWDRAQEAAWPAARASSSASYGARNTMRFEPTRSRRQGEPICKLTAKKTVEGERATAARFGRCLVMVRTASGGAPASRACSEASSCSLLASCPANCSKQWQKTQIWWLPRVQRVLDLRAKMHTVGCAIYRAF